MKRVYTPATIVPRKTAPRVKGMLTVIALEQERKKWEGGRGNDTVNQTRIRLGSH